MKKSFNYLINKWDLFINGEAGKYIFILGCINMIYWFLFFLLYIVSFIGALLNNFPLEIEKGDILNIGIYLIEDKTPIGVILILLAIYFAISLSKIFKIFPFNGKRK